MQHSWPLIGSEELVDLEAHRNREFRLLARWDVQVLLEFLLGPKYLAVAVKLVRYLLK